MSNQHWTAESTKAFRFRVVSDFLLQIEKRLEQLEWTHNQLAEALGVSKGRVSQILNNPGNMTLELMIRCARALNLKVAAIAYDDGDLDNQRGPISSEVFRISWEKLNKPLDVWSVQETTTVILSLDHDHDLHFGCFDTTGVDACPKLHNYRSPMENLLKFSSDIKGLRRGIGEYSASSGLEPSLFPLATTRSQSVLRPLQSSQS